MTDLGNYGIVISGFTNVPFTSSTQQIYNLSSALFLATDGGVINGVDLALTLSGTITAYTAIDFGKVVILGPNAQITIPNVTSMVGNSLISSVGAATFNFIAASLTTLTLPLFKYCLTGSFSPTFASLTTMSLPSLKIIATTFSPTLAACTTLSLPALAYIGTTVAISAAQLTTLSLPALVGVGTTFAITAANLVTFSMGSTLLTIGGNFTMTGMKLDQASVDGILVSLAALDGTGGTTAYSSLTVNLSGGTSSAPSATGLAAKAVLVGRSCSVTTN